MSNLTYVTPNGEGFGNATLLLDPTLCTLQTCDLSMASFLYIPNLGGNAFYAAIFGAFFCAQLALGIKGRVWGYMGAMLAGLVLEVIGYVGRIMLNSSPFSNNNFLIYLVTLTIAPAFFTAAIYLCLARIVTVYGTHLSRFAPRTYTLVFCGCDFISLLLQAVGGAIASTANTSSSSLAGKNIMLAGLIFQVASLGLFGLCCAEFAWRVRSSKQGRNELYTDLTRSTLFKCFLCGKSHRP
ncbi:hypothetical protein BP5796_06860 [Coleophoma crateriformis]|uniref:RTA1-domain-containing protein n=1 Tax=Coleophoma crateriformis TaxID=565419 RepID=A0A3D8RPR3_9HELO|nr:hypothetical protein BP5796_06860 [Coleophoma crateriformis]